MEDVHMTRVERMFGPKESWGKGDEMAAVRQRAVRQEGGGSPGKAGKDNLSAACGNSSPKRGAKGNGTGAVPCGKTGSGAKEAKKAGFNRGGAPWGGLAGFVSIRCDRCGKVTNTCLHDRTPVFTCKGCGHGTSLEKVANIHFKCGRCGFVGKYRTNRTEDKIQMECLNCSDIVYLTKMRRGNYVPEVEAWDCCR